MKSQVLYSKCALAKQVPTCNSVDIADVIRYFMNIKLVIPHYNGTSEFYKLSFQIERAMETPPLLLLDCLSIIW